MRGHVAGLRARHDQRQRLASTATKLASIDNAGKKQVTIDGVPLYYFSGDTKAGDTNGQGVGGIWFVVDATGKAIK